MPLFRRDPDRRAFDLSQDISGWLTQRVTGSQQPRTREDFETAARELIRHANQLASQRKERDPSVVARAIHLRRVGGSIGFGPGVDVTAEIASTVAQVAVDLLVADGAPHPEPERLRALKAQVLREINEQSEGK